VQLSLVLKLQAFDLRIPFSPTCQAFMFFVDDFRCSVCFFLFDQFSFAEQFNPEQLRQMATLTESGSARGLLLKKKQL